jgi:hypothetical protein
VHRGEVAIALAHVEAVAHDEVGRDPEPDVAEIQFGLLEPLFDQERAHLQ